MERDPSPGRQRQPGEPNCRFDEAAQAFRGAIELDPKYVKAYNNLGACLAEADRLDEAIIVFEEATRSVPEYANSYKNLAMAYVSLKRPGPAIEWMNRYLALVPEDNAARVILDQLHEAAAVDTTTTDGVGN